jgi:6-phosphogluconolactonase
MHSRLIGLLSVFLATLAGAAVSARRPASSQSSGFVYVATNQPSGNMVVQFARASDGSLTPVSSAATGGVGGTGNGVGSLDPLGSQDSLVLTANGGVVLVVNAGSNDISSLRADAGRLALVSKVPSGGNFPNSVAVNGDLVYVVNAHATPNISAFRLGTDGTLTAITNSTRALPGGSNSAPHDVRFSPDGMRLLVTEGGTNQFDIFELSAAGVATAVNTQSVAGSGPFGFKFGRAGVLASAEADSASVSSYSLNPDNTLTVVSAAVPNGQAASCWITLTADGKFAFISDTGSGTLSSYSISGNWMVTLVDGVATTDGGAPIDSALSNDGAFLYVEDSALGRILSYRVHGASLAPLATILGFPTTIQGIAAR